MRSVTYQRKVNGVVVEEREIALSDRKRSLRLGDAIAAVATPMARALKLSCVDPETKELRPESNCAKRKAKLNRLI